MVLAAALACAGATGPGASEADINGCRVCRSNCPSGVAPGAYYREDSPLRCESPFPTAERPFTTEQFCSAEAPARVRVVFRWLAGLNGGLDVL